MLDQVYGAIADPTRRDILNILTEGEVNVGSLAERFPISLNGVSKHVKVLERAGLVETGREAQFRPRRLRPQPLQELSDWLDRYRAFWEGSLDQLGLYLETVKSGKEDT